MGVTFGGVLSPNLGPLQVTLIAAIVSNRIVIIPCHNNDNKNSLSGFYISFLAPIATEERQSSWS